MATLTTKFGIGDVTYAFDPVVGVFTRYVIGAVIVKRGSTTNVNVAPDIIYYTQGKSPCEISEADALTEQEARDLGNAWLAEKSINMFTDVGL